MFFIMLVAETRKIYAAKRDALSPSERAQKSEEIWKRLVTLAPFKETSQALFYVSFRSEVETLLMRRLTRKLGISVAVPRIQAQNKSMIFYELGCDEKLEAGVFGVLQPTLDAETITDLKEPSVILVPGLVFDSQGNRVGWGGGYYDRFLSDEGKGLPSVGLAFDLQIAAQLPVQPYDVALNWIVTESRIIHCSKY